MDWFVEAHDIPFQCSVDAILSFLHDKKKALLTTKVGFDGKTAGEHTLVCWFMKAMLSLKVAYLLLTLATAKYINHSSCFSIGCPQHKLHRLLIPIFI